MEQVFNMEAENSEVSLLQQEQSSVSVKANALEVTNKLSYDYAMDFLRNIKSVAKNIENYWAEPKRKANEVWKSIVAKEKAMLEPLTQAETIVKKKMSTYAEEQQRIERELQQRLEQERRAEADRLMQIAAEEEAQCNEIEAQVNMQMAQTLETPSNYVGNTKQSGTREIKTLVVDKGEEVPTYIDGICLRPVDLVAVKRYYQLTGKLPAGISVKTETIIAVR